MTHLPLSPVTARAKLLEELERATYVTLHGVNWTLGLGTADQQALIDALRTSGHAQCSKVPDGFVLVPRELTAENGAKSAPIGEFSETFDYMDDEGVECQAEIPVSWTTIKEIHKKMVALFALTDTSTGRQSGPTPGFRLIEEPCEHHHCEFPSCGCEVPISSPDREASK